MHIYRRYRCPADPSRHHLIFRNPYGTHKLTIHALRLRASYGKRKFLRGARAGTYDFLFNIPWEHVGTVCTSRRVWCDSDIIASRYHAVHSIYGWACSQPISECTTHVTTPLIGQDLVQSLREIRPGSLSALITTCCLIDAMIDAMRFINQDGKIRDGMCPFDNKFLFCITIKNKPLTNTSLVTINKSTIWSCAIIHFCLIYTYIY